MKYILLGSINSKWLNKQSERYTKSSKKLKQLGIKLENVYYTQGQFDFVDVINAPGAESVLSFSIWYANKGYGRIQSLPAFGDKVMKKVINK